MTESHPKSRLDETIRVAVRDWLNAPSHEEKARSALSNEAGRLLGEVAARMSSERWPVTAEAQAEADREWEERNDLSAAWVAEQLDRMDEMFGVSGPDVQAAWVRLWDEAIASGYAARPCLEALRTRVASISSEAACLRSPESLRLALSGGVQ